LGFAGVAEIHRLTNIPRNKVYETLDTFVKRGIVEVRPGRPRLFRLIRPRTVIEQLTEEYNRTAKEAFELLEEETTHAKLTEESDYVWIMKGNRTLKQRFTELIADARSDIFLLEPFPPKYLLSCRAILSAAKRRGVRVRAVSLAGHTIAESLSREPLVEYRILNNKADELAGAADVGLLRYFRETMQPLVLLVHADNEQALIMVKELSDEKNVTGILIRIPGLPALARPTLERMLTLFTKGRN
jgi:hypothetical protein